MSTFMLFLIFYYIFSVIFMLGYVDFKTESKFWWVKILGFVAILIIAPFLMPFNIGTYIWRNSIK